MAVTLPDKTNSTTLSSGIVGASLAPSSPIGRLGRHSRPKVAGSVDYQGLVASISYLTMFWAVMGASRVKSLWWVLSGRVG